MRTSTPGLLRTRIEIVLSADDGDIAAPSAPADISGAPFGLGHLVLRAIDDHVPQRRARGDHGEHVVLLDDLGLDEHGAVVVRVRGLEDAIDLRRTADAERLDAVRARELDEVGVALEIDAREAVVEEQL